MLSYARKTSGGKYYFFCVIVNLIYALVTIAPAITAYMCFVGFFSVPTDSDRVMGIIISAIFSVMWLVGNIYLFARYRGKSKVNFIIFFILALAVIAIVYFIVWFLMIRY